MAKVIEVSTLTAAELREAGLTALYERLGYEGTSRFLRTLGRTHDDYLHVQDSIFAEMTVDQIHEDAAAFERAYPDVRKGKEVI